MVNKNMVSVVHLYPKDMNIYGDSGNILALKYRLEQRGYGFKLTTVNPGETIPDNVDILVGGGGQDSGQERVLSDLKKKTATIQKLVDDGVSMLLVCGLYQLFGHEFITHDGKKLEGTGVFDMHTLGESERLIGNITVENRELGKIVGFENHSGQTFLSGSQSPLGVVLKGAGNNAKTDDEGAITNNAFGTYLHGPVLPKNPQLADELIKRAMERKYGVSELPEIDSRLEVLAAEVALERPR